MEQLWAPWRLGYVTDPAAKAKPTTADACFLCTAANGTDDRANLLVHRTDLSVVVLNKFPYNNGHLLVSPREHRGRLDELSPDQLLDLQLVLKKMLGILEKRMSPDGFNIGLNVGRVAGAGLPGHLHWHIVPRWSGDVNFMPVLAGTKVIVQSLDALYDLLMEEIQS